MIVLIVPFYPHRSLGVPYGFIAEVARRACCDGHLRLRRIAIAARPSAEGVALQRRVVQRDGGALYGVLRGIGRSHRAAYQLVFYTICNRCERCLHRHVGRRHRQLVDAVCCINRCYFHLAAQRYFDSSGRVAARLGDIRGNGLLRCNAVQLIACVRRGLDINSSPFLSSRDCRAATLIAVKAYHAVSVGASAIGDGVLYEGRHSDGKRRRSLA